MRFMASLDTTIYGRAYIQGATVDTSTWSRRQLLQFLDNGIISPADVTTEDLQSALGDTLLGQLGDVHVSGVQPGDALIWDGTDWVPGHISTAGPLIRKALGPTTVSRSDVWATVADLSITVPATGAYLVGAQVAHDGDVGMGFRILQGTTAIYPQQATASNAGWSRAPGGLSSIWEWGCAGIYAFPGASNVISLQWAAAAGGSGDFSLVNATLSLTPATAV